MKTIVQKYGGKLVADKEKMRKIAQIIASTYDEGNRVVVTISAMGDTTNILQEKISEFSVNPNKREVDVVLSVGEQISIGLLSMILNDMGYRAISLTGWQAEIQTDSNYTNSNILNINTKNIEEKLDNGYIVIVAGFQGIDKEMNITTLGRGGSDTTAICLAIAMNAEYCEIYKDTRCIFTADPKIIKNAKKLNFIGYDQMLELSKMGAKVLATKAIECARDHNLEIVVKAVDTNEIGTVISSGESTTNYPMVSCTKKESSINKDIVTFLKNKAFNSKNKVYLVVEKIIEEENIKDYIINNNNDKVSIIIDKDKSLEILSKVHDRLI